MKTALIIAGSLVATLIVAIAILAVAAPKHISVRSTQLVKASRQQVYDQLRYMKNFPAWSPFLVQDPDQKYTISGPDGQVGDTYSWVGVREKGRGSQHVAQLVANERVVIACNITEPFQSTPTFTYTLTEHDGGTLVTQDFDAPMPPPANIFGLLFGLKGKIAATNQQGLGLLKDTTEKLAVAAH
jgi:hypothetical protein